MRYLVNGNIDKLLDSEFVAKSIIFASDVPKVLWAHRQPPTDTTFNIIMKNDNVYVDNSITVYDIDDDTEDIDASEWLTRDDIDPDHVLELQDGPQLGSIMPMQEDWLEYSSNYDDLVYSIIDYSIYNWFDCVYDVICKLNETYNIKSIIKFTFDSNYDVHDTTAIFILHKNDDNSFWEGTGYYIYNDVLILGNCDGTFYILHENCIYLLIFDLNFFGNIVGYEQDGYYKWLPIAFASEAVLESIALADEPSLLVNTTPPTFPTPYEVEILDVLPDYVLDDVRASDEYNRYFEG